MLFHQEEVEAQAAPAQPVSGLPNGGGQHSKGAALDGDAAKLEGVPALPACRVRLLWEDDPGRAAQVPLTVLQPASCYGP